MKFFLDHDVPEEVLDQAAWDKQIEADSASGKLDFLFEEAEKERAAGTLRDWPED